MTDYSTLLQEFNQEYTKRNPISEKLQQKAKQFMSDGGSHTLRLMQPFPLRIVEARGSRVKDEDGHEVIDFWQGHFANLLGHNPEFITSALSKAFASGWGLQTGYTDSIQVDLAELACKLTHTERIRFTTSGALATMFSVMLSRAFTGRDMVLKIRGGWHGGHPWGLKGVVYDRELAYDHMEGEGIPETFYNQVIQTAFNDPDMLEKVFKEYGNKLACFIMEPFQGNSGFIPATREFIQAARRLTAKYGVIFILDEIISGFRFYAGDLGNYYGIQPDLATFAKIFGGGMPVAAVAGRADIMELAAISTGPKVKFSGGTYSAHPSSMLASKVMLEYLVAHEQEIYPHINALGKKARHDCVNAFIQEGVYCYSTGYHPTDLPESSVFILHFPLKEGATIHAPEEANDPKLTDTTLRRVVVRLGLLLNDINMTEGKGIITTAHTEADIDKVTEACYWVAKKIRKLRV